MDFGMLQKECTGLMDPKKPIQIIGGGGMGGKARGLDSIREALCSVINARTDLAIQVGIPSFAVLGTVVFDTFMRDNKLYSLVSSDPSDEQLLHAFQAAELPFEILGSMRSMIEDLHVPLAIRSSSLLEDSTHSPFAGIYETKMIPNEAYDADIRFRQLVQAIKLVYSSTFLARARDYRRVIGRKETDEKMAVIIQELVGKRYFQRFYPELSGVARSYNYYPVKPAMPEEGVVNLALGLGKTIVDGGISWTYSPAYPAATPPFRSAQETLELTQSKFWVVNMGEPAEYDPTRETEYMLEENICAADEDETLRYLVSTYDVESERLVAGTGLRGPRALTFAPLLVLHEKQLNEIILETLNACAKELRSPVEVEFAMTFNPDQFFILQVRPMVIPEKQIHVLPDELASHNTLLASENILGNGEIENITDIVFVKPQDFDMKFTQQMVPELEQLNRKLLSSSSPYLLVVLGRLGTTDPWLGIPASWGQVCGAKVVVEVAQENVNVELSQGTHYFHNIINLGVLYFCMSANGKHRVDWDWLNHQQIVEDGRFVRHVRTPTPMKIRVDGRRGLGVVKRPEEISK